MVGNAVDQIKTSKPAVCEVQMHLFTETPLRSESKAIPHQQHPDEPFWIARRTARVAVDLCEMRADAGQINEPVNRP